MKLTQLSLFIENKSGSLRQPMEVLSEKGLNISTLSLADTQQFGILRLIIKEWEKAKEALESAGLVVNKTEVVAIKIGDKPGGLVEMIDLMDDLGINIEYMYAFATTQGKDAIVIFRFEDPDKAIEAFEGKGINVVGSIELFQNT